MASKDNHEIITGLFNRTPVLLNETLSADETPDSQFRVCFDPVDLAILGGFQGAHFDAAHQKFRTAKFGRGQQGTRIPYQDIQTGVPFMFVPGVNVGPVFLRTAIWHELGGFDLAYSSPGRAGIHFDYEISLRTWSRGWQVGLYSPSGFQRNVGVGGSDVFTIRLHKQSKYRASERDICNGVR